MFCNAHLLCNLVAVDNDHFEEPYNVILWEALQRGSLTDKLSVTDRERLQVYGDFCGLNS